MPRMTGPEIQQIVDKRNARLVPVYKPPRRLSISSTALHGQLGYVTAATARAVQSVLKLPK